MKNKERKQEEKMEKLNVLEYCEKIGLDIQKAIFLQNEKNDVKE